MKLSVFLPGVEQARAVLTCCCKLLLPLLTSFTVCAAEPKVAGGIYVGQSAAFSGPSQALGLDVRRGIDAYLSHVNRSGGIDGRQVLLKSMDDMGQPVTAVENVKRLVLKEGVVALLASVGATTSDAVAETTTGLRVPFIGPVSGAEGLRQANRRFTYNLRAGQVRESQQLASQLASMGITTAAVVYQDDLLGKEGAASFEEAGRANRIRVLAQQKAGLAGAEIQEAAQNIAKLKPQAVVLFATYDVSIEVIRAARTAGYGAMFMTVSSAGSKAINEELLEGARGMVMTQVVPFPWTASVPLVNQYQKLMLENGHSEKDFSYGSLEGFLAARVLVEGLKRTGKDASPSKLVDALDGLGVLDLGGVQLRFSTQERESSKFVELTVIGQGGRFIK